MVWCLDFCDLTGIASIILSRHVGESEIEVNFIDRILLTTLFLVTVISAHTRGYDKPLSGAGVQI